MSTEIRTMLIDKCRELEVFKELHAKTSLIRPYQCWRRIRAKVDVVFAMFGCR